jgi:hypothetical protein
MCSAYIFWRREKDIYIYPKDQALGEASKLSSG